MNQQTISPDDVQSMLSSFIDGLDRTGGLRHFRELAAPEASNVTTTSDSGTPGSSGSFGSAATGTTLTRRETSTVEDVDGSTHQTETVTQYHDFDNDGGDDTITETQTIHREFPDGSTTDITSNTVSSGGMTITNSTYTHTNPDGSSTTTGGITVTDPDGTTTHTSTGTTTTEAGEGTDKDEKVDEDNETTTQGADSGGLWVPFGEEDRDRPWDPMAGPFTLSFVDAAAKLDWMPGAFADTLKDGLATR